IISNLKGTNSKKVEKFLKVEETDLTNNEVTINQENLKEIQMLLMEKL
ncbi:40332_t:CDS:1, partial [Gigaspora margarita]